MNAGRVGGKAAGLARLVELGFPVPPLIVLAVGEELEDPHDVVVQLGEPLAVRSSAAGEDGTERSAAGQYESLLDVREPGLLDAIARVRSSTRRAAAYGATGDIAVVIQRQVLATRAGIAFSRDPVTGADDVVVECALGGGDAIASGQITPDRYRIAGGEVRARAAGRIRTLRDDEAVAIAQVVRRAEAGFGLPVDVEFCLDGRELWIVQCRPITTP